MYAQILLAAGLVGLSAAANTCTVTQTTTLDGANPTGLAGCTTVEGDVAIGEDAQQVNLNDVETITGGLTAENAGFLSSLAAPQLSEIGGQLELINLTTLSALSFPALTKVQSIHFEALPALSSLTFDKEVDTADSILVTNTFLSSLDGINLETVTDFNINNNGRLRNISTQIESIKGALIVEANGGGLVLDFPNLKYASNFTVRNVAGVNIPSLEAINGSMGFYENDFDSIFAPNLTTVGINDGRDSDGGIAIVDNEKLTNMSFPEFAKSGGAVLVANNTLLNAVSFPKLEFVSGAIDITGNFTTPELPSVSDLKGAFNVQSKQQIDCSQYNNIHDNVVTGKFTCVTTDNTKTIDEGGNDGSSSGGKSGGKKSAGTQVSFNYAALGLCVLGGIFSMLA